MKKFELSTIGVRKLNVNELIAIINGNTYGKCTIERAKTALSSIDPNFRLTGHLLN